MPGSRGVTEEGITVSGSFRVIREDCGVRRVAGSQRLEQLDVDRGFAVSRDLAVDRHPDVLVAEPEIAPVTDETPGGDELVQVLQRSTGRLQQRNVDPASEQS